MNNIHQLIIGNHGTKLVTEKEVNNNSFYDQYQLFISSDTKDLDAMIVWCVDKLDEQGNDKFIITKIIADLYFGGDKSLAEPFVEYL